MLINLISSGKKRVYFLVNANNRIGIGHLVRCKIIAEELKSININSVFIFSDTPSEQISSTKEKYEVIYLDLIKTYSIYNYINFINHELLVIDSDNKNYYSEKFQKNLLSVGIKFMHITVNPNYKYYSHILLNQNIISTTQNYNTEAYTCKMLGPTYFIFKKEFRNECLISVNNNKFPLTMFLAFGGADQNNLTCKLLNSIIILKQYFKEVIVVIGGLNKNVEKIKDFIKTSSLKINLHINTANIHGLMQNSDVAIVSSGLTFWELSILGIPSFMLVSSEREREITNFLHDNRYCYKLGEFDNLPSDILISNNIKAVLDKGLLKRINIEGLKRQINVNGVNLVVDEIAKVIS